MKNKLLENDILLQIQPQYAFGQEWDAFAEQENLTYEALELSAPPALNESGRFQACREWYLKCGRTTSLHGVFIGIDPASGDREICELSRRRIRESCELAAELGAENIVLHSSCCTFLRGGYLDYWAGQCAEFFSEIAQIYPLRVFIENSQDADPSPLKELMRRITDEKVGVCLDLGHANYSNATLDMWFDELADWIGYLHLSDNNGWYDDHFPLGDGTVDWKTADRLSRMLGRKMPMTLETGDLSGVRKSLQFLKENGYFVFSEG